MKRKLIVSLLAAAWLLCLPFLALSEEARVITPGGKLHMRKAADEKSAIVEDVPNRALVEAEEVGDEWSRIVYKRKTGYVKTAFLKLPSDLPGKTVYPDEGTVLLRKAPAEDAPVAGVLGCREKAEIISVSDGWLEIRLGEGTAYAEAKQFSCQLDAPEGKAEWISEEAAVAAECALKNSSAADAAIVASLPVGQAVTVTVIEKDMCLIVSELGCGWIPKGSVRLIGVQDTGGTAGEVTPSAAVQAASAALKKAYRPFSKEKLYYQITTAEEKNGIAGPVYLVGFFNEQDQYVYAAAVHAESKAVLFTQSYAGFAVPSEEDLLLPAGEVTVTLSAEEICVGDVIDVTVDAWTRRQIQYSILLDGEQMALTQPCEHFSASFRPQEAGDYAIVAIVSDARGNVVEAEAEFTVTGEKGPVAYEQVYSQKDGWWRNVPYRHSNMEHSGCAVFALSHALGRMGVDAPAALPDALAVAYAQCLTQKEGTNNERLITSAAKDFGFKTQRALIKDQKQIVKLLKEGAFFSFRVARGHIAMISGVSEDGTMVRVVDSAPSATFERKINVEMYYQMRSGSFRAAQSLDELPGARWYIDSQDYGGLEYWMPVSYPAKLGVRLIQPQPQDEGEDA